MVSVQSLTNVPHSSSSSLPAWYIHERMAQLDSNTQLRTGNVAFSSECYMPKTKKPAQDPDTFDPDIEFLQGMGPSTQTRNSFTTLS